MSTLAFLRFDKGDEDGPQLAEQAYELAVATGDSELLKEAGFALGHVLLWSDSTERARTFLEAEQLRWCDRDEEMSGFALWALAFVELRAGRWSLAAEYAARVREMNLQRGVDDSEAPQSAYAVAAHRRPSRRDRPCPCVLQSWARACRSAENRASAPSIARGSPRFLER